MNQTSLTFSKTIKFVIVAIVAAIIGYFIGAGFPPNQGASLFKGTQINLDSKQYYKWENGKCWYHYTDNNGDWQKQSNDLGHRECDKMLKNKITAPAVLEPGATNSNSTAR